ncbi:hypothetical protein BY996DRAFT_6422434 [Phakopsora pachyrhizi]|nr:hypothetical protein BY996DRAFT_6422434 [Phakopsora pachyrhizi]
MSSHITSICLLILISTLLCSHVASYLSPNTLASEESRSTTILKRKLRKRAPPIPPKVLQLNKTPEKASVPVISFTSSESKIISDSKLMAMNNIARKQRELATKKSFFRKIKDLFKWLGRPKLFGSAPKMEKVKHTAQVTGIGALNVVAWGSLLAWLGWVGERIATLAG